MSRMTVFCTAAVTAVLIFAPSAQAKDKTKKPPKDFAGLYIGFGLTNVAIGGDMDGMTSVSGGGSSEVLPDLETGDGTKILVGYHWDSYSVEVNVVDSDHDGVWGGLPFPSNYSSLNIDGKWFFRERIKPFALAGIGATDVQVQDGSTDGFSLADATFSGVDVRLGGGVHFPIARRFAIEAQAVYRRGKYKHVDGIASGDLEGSLSGDGVTISIEAKISLFRGKK